MKKFILFLFATVLFTSCLTPGPTVEPELGVYIITYAIHYPDTVAVKTCEWTPKGRTKEGYSPVVKVIIRRAATANVLAMEHESGFGQVIIEESLCPIEVRSCKRAK